LECVSEEGRKITLQGIQKLVLVRQISTLQMRKYCRKGCPLYAIQLLKTIEGDKPSLEDHPTLREYRDVFLEEVPSLPPRRDINFSIELAPGVVPVSRTPYRMSTPELVELKLQLKEMMDKGKIPCLCTKLTYETSKWYSVVRVWCFGILAPGITKGKFPFLLMFESRLVKPRNGIAWLEFGVSAFWHPGYPRASFLVFACREIPTCETPKRA
jgi:hypothetical protein